MIATSSTWLIVDGEVTQLHTDGRAMSLTPCEICGLRFRAVRRLTRPTQRYCSRDCAQDARRRFYLELRRSA